jgi:hypothetical protein
MYSMDWAIWSMLMASQVGKDLVSSMNVPTSVSIFIQFRIPYMDFTCNAYNKDLCFFPYVKWVV